MRERKGLDRLLTLGLVALAAAGGGSYLVQRKLGVPEAAADAVSGFLYGVAITLLLLGLRRSRKLPGSTVTR